MNSNSFRTLRRHLLREVVAPLLFYSMLLQSAMAAAPGWWSTQGVLIPNKPADDYAALNQGQLKLLASKAWLQMELALPGGAGPQLTQMLSGWRLVQPQTDDYGVVNAGQLKHVARPFYQRLKDAGLLTMPAWCAPQAGTDDYALVNVGQAQMIFSFAIPQALGGAPQRMSGNGMAGAGTLPGGYPWGSGRPPLGAATGLTPPGVLPPGSEAAVSTSPFSAADLSKVAPPTDFTVESQWAMGSAARFPKSALNPDGTIQYDSAGKAVRDGWSWSGTAYALPGGDFQSNFQSLGALEGALTSMSQLPAAAGGGTWTMSLGLGDTSLGFGGNGWLGSGYHRFLDDDGEESVSEWSGTQAQYRAFGGGATTAHPRDAWFKIDRSISVNNQIVARTVEFTPYVIAATRDEAAVMNVAAKHWDTDGEHEFVQATLVLPELLQINDGDADGDEVPDFADGMNAEYPLPEDEPDLPQTARLMNLPYGIGYHPNGQVRFLYAASDPAGVTVTGSGANKTYQPAAGGALRLWRENFNQSFQSHTVSRNPGGHGRQVKPKALCF